jgi:hypothetical protein
MTRGLWTDLPILPSGLLEALLLRGAFNLHSLEELVQDPFGTTSLLAMRKKQ